MQYKLGRNPSSPEHLAKRLWLSKYLKADSLPTIPTATDWRAKAAKSLSQLYLNQTLGDCTCAGMGHLIGIYTANETTDCVLTDAQILTAYEAVGGYRPGHPATDNGANLGDCLQYWKTTGVGGHKIANWVAIDPTNEQELKIAIALFGGVYAGVNLPSRWESNTTKWDKNAGMIIGGHCIDFIDYDVTGFYSSSWGMAIPTTFAGISEYCDEAYAILSPDWYSKGFSPSGFDADALASDLQALETA